MFCGDVVERAVVTTLAGSGSSSFANGVGSNASFYNPLGVAVDASGNVFVTDAHNNRIRKVLPGAGTRIGLVTPGARVADNNDSACVQS